MYRRQGATPPPPAKKTEAFAILSVEFYFRMNVFSQHRRIAFNSLADKHAAYTLFTDRDSTGGNESPSSVRPSVRLSARFHSVFRTD